MHGFLSDAPIVFFLAKINERALQGELDRLYRIFDSLQFEYIILVQLANGFISGLEGRLGLCKLVISNLFKFLNFLGLFEYDTSLDLCLLFSH